MRIAYLTPTSIYSGGEKITLGIAASMQERDHEVMYMGLAGPVEGAVREAGVPFYVLPKFSLRAVQQALKAFKPDLVHCMDFRASTYASFFSWPVVAHLHNNPPWLKNFNANSLGMLFFAWRARKILTVSHSVWDDFALKQYFCSGLKKIHMLPNCVDISEVVKKSHESSDDIKSKSFDVAFMGRFVEQKQPEKFVDCMHALRKTYPTLQVVMIGDGELRQQVENKIRAYGLEDVITLTGVQKNPFPWLAASKLLLMPSAWEGFGLAAVEAMALGKPVVASAVGGLKDVVCQECGALCASEEELVTATSLLLSEDNMYAQASIAAQERAKQFTDFTGYYDAIEAVYGDICDR